MNRWAIAGLAVVIALSAFGCERKGSQQAGYDQKVDAQPSPGLQTPSDSGILGDQAQISKNAEPAKPASTGTPTGTTSSAPASGPESTTSPASSPAPASASAPASTPS
jgi:hypothetical protein